MARRSTGEAAEIRRALRVLRARTKAIGRGFERDSGRAARRIDLRARIWRRMARLTIRLSQIAPVALPFERNRWNVYQQERASNARTIAAIQRGAV